MTYRALIFWAAFGLTGLAACTTVTEAPPCGPGTVAQADGSCVPDTDAVCGAGTTLDGGVCVAASAEEDGVLVEEDVSVTLPDLAGIDVPVSEDLGACVPRCDGRECGDDGCGGSCGACAAGACNGYGVCVDPGWTCGPDRYGSGLACDCGCGAEDLDCGPGSVLPTVGCQDGQTCQAGVCSACTPSCAFSECGDDGCGGSCGKCHDPTKPYCEGGKCVETCVPTCQEHECGDDGCGGGCGGCGAGTHCVLDHCVDLPAALSCEGSCGQVTSGGCSCTAGCSGGGCCGDLASACPCEAQCDGRACGADGCGGVCGSCGAGEACVGGACVDGDPCDPSPCAAHGACDAGLCLCEAGYAGQDCGQCAVGYTGYPDCLPDPCANESCSGKGSCNATTGACECLTGFTGPYCNQCSDPAAAFPTCDQPDPCYDVFCFGKGTCNPASGVCDCIAGYAGADCSECDNPNFAWPGCGVTCTGDAQCFDADGCTVDTCDAGACKNVSCARSDVVWSPLQPGDVPAQATAASPFGFAIDAQTSVSFYRSNDWPLSTYTPVAAADGSFVSAALSGVELGWSGAFTYINIDVPGGTANNAGSLTFDFGAAAIARGASWRYIVGVAALGFAGTGPTDLTFSEPVQELGRFDGFQTNAYATLSADGRVLSAPAGPNTGLQFFAVPPAATAVTLTIDDQGTVGPDTFGVWVGAVDVDVVTCRSGPQGNVCVANFCGDGVRAGGEECDDGNNGPTDGCDATCHVEAGYTCVGAVRSVCAQ